MTVFIRQQIEGKKICLLGFGAEGQSGYRVLRHLFPELEFAIADRDESVSNHWMLAGDERVDIITGNDYLSSLDDYDLILKSPGIPFSLLSGIDREKISSQTEMFIRAFRTQIIGVTGTKGKSTTSSLIHHIVLQHTSNVLLLGNIGVPFFEKLDKIDNNTIIICEMSSHQLENICVSPHIAVMLNIYEEHLDHYRSFHDYQLAKFNIAKYQDRNDYFIFNADDLNIQQLINEYVPRGIFLPYSFSAEPASGCMLSEYDIVFRKNEEAQYTLDSTLQKNLKGDHNLLNIMAAVCVCKTLDIPGAAIDEGIRTFAPLEHRVEYAGRFHGIDFYNDSIATIPEATIAAVKTVNHVETILLGGFDRGVDYRALMDFLAGSAVSSLVFMGKAGERMYSLITENSHHGKKLYIAAGLNDAVGWALKNTAPGKACLLSPAAASYDAFKNFAERGTAFKRLISE